MNPSIVTDEEMAILSLEMAMTVGPLCLSSCLHRYSLFATPLPNRLLYPRRMTGTEIVFVSMRVRESDTAVQNWMRATRVVILIYRLNLQTSFSTRDYEAPLTSWDSRRVPGGRALIGWLVDPLARWGHCHYLDKIKR